MSLEKRIKKEEKKIPRRSFLKKSVYTISSILLASYIGLGIGACKKTPFTPEPPIPVTLNFEVYNHTKGYITSFSKNTISGNPVPIKISEINASGVDDKRIVIREDNFGRWVASNLTTGEASFIAPRQNQKNYDIFLFNNSNNAPYNCMDEQNSKLYLDKRNYVVYRKDFDGQTGPERAWGGQPLPEIGGQPGVFDQLNNALKPSWAPFKYGSISRQPNAGRGDFSYGYGNCYGRSGVHAGTYIAVNPKKCYGIMEKVGVGLEEAFENITRTDNICGAPSLMTIQKWGVLLPKGKDLFAYVFVKDSASINTKSGFKFSIGFE